jgi:hypothetical protein
VSIHERDPPPLGHPQCAEVICGGRCVRHSRPRFTTTHNSLTETTVRLVASGSDSGKATTAIPVARGPDRRKRRRRKTDHCQGSSTCSLTAICPLSKRSQSALRQPNSLRTARNPQNSPIGLGRSNGIRFWRAHFRKIVLARPFQVDKFGDSRNELARGSDNPAPRGRHCSELCRNPVNHS